MIKNNGIFNISQAECTLCVILRDLALSKIEKLGKKEAAEKLGLYPKGLERLIWENPWDLQTSFRIIENLNIEISIIFKNSIFTVLKEQDDHLEEYKEF